ncbi:MAG: hypothetical protein H0U76_18050 [Ktedonobacteraceae bacterium]|nr:hypothetical protein [Ktedonobacteraceae bacterium]
MNEEWVPMNIAARRLKAENIKIRRNKISRLANRKIIQVRDNPLDARIRLVNLYELRALFEQYGNQMGDSESSNDEDDDET